MKAVVAAFNQEKALVGAFSVITNLRMELFQALVKLLTCSALLPEPPVGDHGHGAAVEAAGAAARAAARTARTRARAEAGGRAHVTCHGPRDIPATWRVITDSPRGMMVFLK